MEMDLSIDGRGPTKKQVREQVYPFVATDQLCGDNGATGERLSISGRVDDLDGLRRRIEAYFVRSRNMAGTNADGVRCPSSIALMKRLFDFEGGTRWCVKLQSMV